MRKLIALLLVLALVAALSFACGEQTVNLTTGPGDIDQGDTNGVNQPQHPADVPESSCPLCHAPATTD